MLRLPSAPVAPVPDVPGGRSQARRTDGEASGEGGTGMKLRDLKTLTPWERAELGVAFGSLALVALYRGAVLLLLIWILREVAKA
jgi:hypothetical protein